MKTIMVDMDDVLVYGSFGKILEDYLGYKPDYKKTGYYTQNALGDKKDDFFNKFKDMNMYKDVSLIKDAYSVLKNLSKTYEIYIVTDYIWQEIIEYAGNNLKNKYEFLYKELDFINPRNFIFSCNKSLINCDIKIDDKISNLENASTKLLYTAYHNDEISDDELKCQNIVRVNNWKEIESYLIKKENAN